mgnify:CR=1 FL=1
MKSVWKYPLALIDEQDVIAPAGAVPLSVQMQRSLPCVWMLVDPAVGSVPYRVRIVGTGHEITTPIGEFLGTMQTSNGSLVWHVFIEALQEAS